MKGKGWTCVCCWPSKGWWRWWSRHILEPRSPVWKSFWWGLISPGFQQRPQIAETFRNIFSDVTCCSQLQLPAAPEDLEHWCLCQTRLCAPSNSSDGKINENLRRITSQVKEYLYISYMLCSNQAWFFWGSRFRWCALSYFSLIFLMGHNPSHKSQLSRAINWAEGGLVENACSSKAMF